MSGALNNSDQLNASRVDAWVQKYDEAAEKMFKNHDSPQEGARDFSAEHIAYMKAREKVIEKWPSGVEKRELTEEEKAGRDKWWNLKDGRISRISFYRDRE